MANPTSLNQVSPPGYDPGTHGLQPSALPITPKRHVPKPLLIAPRFGSTSIANQTGAVKTYPAYLYIRT